MADLIYNRTTREILYDSGEQREVLNLRPKEQAIWALLVAHYGQPVSRELICHDVWNSRFVSDFTINQTINQLRRKLGDSQRTIITTLPKVGYEIARGKLQFIDAEERSDKPQFDVKNLSDSSITSNKPTSQHELQGDYFTCCVEHFSPAVSQEQSANMMNSYRCSINPRLVCSWFTLLLVFWSGGLGAGHLIELMGEKSVFYVDGFKMKMTHDVIQYSQHNGTVKCIRMPGKQGNVSTKKDQSTVCQLQV